MDDLQQTQHRRKAVNVIRTTIAVVLILFPIINFAWGIPAIIDLLGEDEDNTSLLLDEAQLASEIDQ